jgi:WD repeat-containing protein 48
VEGCTDVSEGECILLCRDTHESSTTEGVNKIVAMDDNLVWTASGSSSIRRWKVPSRRATRTNTQILDPDTDGRRMTESPSGSSLTRNQLGDSSASFHSDSYHDKDDKGMLFGVCFESLIRLTSPNDTFYSSRGRDPEVATLYSAASIMSVPRTNLRSPQRSSISHRNHNHHHPHSHSSPLRSPKTDETVILEMPHARLLYEERELAADAQPLCHEPDSVIVGDNGFVRSVILNDRVHALTVDISGEVAVWDIIRCICKGKYSKEDVAAASMRGSSRDGSDNGRAEREHSPREALESVRERIEGEAVVLPWSAADTKGGLLTIHLNEKCFDAEVYADEVGFGHDRYVTDESKRECFFFGCATRDF